MKGQEMGLSYGLRQWPPRKLQEEEQEVEARVLGWLATVTFSEFRFPASKHSSPIWLNRVRCELRR